MSWWYTLSSLSVYSVLSWQLSVVSGILDMKVVLIICLSIITLELMES